MKFASILTDFSINGLEKGRKCLIVGQVMKDRKRRDREGKARRVSRRFYRNRVIFFVMSCGDDVGKQITCGNNYMPKF
jgi:hypothetical protein